MIGNIRIENFKSFKKEDISLSGLTVLTGLNSSGKSSLIQAIRMAFLASRKKSPFIKGFGSYEELRSRDSHISAHIKIHMSGIISNKEASLNITKDNYHISGAALLEERNVEYIAADRLGPASSLPTFSAENEDISVGDRGQYIVDYYMLFENLVINSKILHTGTSSRTLTHQLEKWMGEISPGVSLEFAKHDRHDISHIEVSGHRANNTGFGISYALPIVLAAIVLSSVNEEREANIMDARAIDWLSKNRKCPPILLVENPEAHLHPRGQTAMGRLLSLAASCGVQIIVETHSDHFIDGIRLQVKSEGLSSRDVSILFFEKESGSETTKKYIKMKGDGKLDSWPRGFFDQTMINLKRLAE